MRELVFNAIKRDSYFLEYVYRRIAQPISSVGGICTLNDSGDKLSLGVAVCDECFSAVNKAAKSAVAEVLAVGYKNRFLKEKINIDTSSLLGRTLLDTMCIFDSNYDTNVIKKNILEINNLSIDGCYNFRLKEIKEKWKEIVALSNNYSAFFEEESVILDFLTYLMDAIPCLCDSVTVLVDLPKNNFQLVDGADRLLTKFETFLEKDDLAEQVLFNLICFNPNVVRYCGDMDELGEEFCYVVNEIFNVREFLDTKLQ